MAVNAHPYKHLVAPGPSAGSGEDAAVAVSPEGSLLWTAAVLEQVGGSCLVLSCFCNKTACASAVFCCGVILEGLSAGAEGTAIDILSVAYVRASFGCGAVGFFQAVSVWGKAPGPSSSGTIHCHRVSCLGMGPG